MVMASWSATELSTVETTDELRISSSRGDGSRTRPVTIWAVSVGDSAFSEETDPSVNAAVDAAYGAKYQRYAKSIVDSTRTGDARGATLKVVPR
jgi:hypothetical protein